MPNLKWFWCLFLLPAICLSQILNGSFETDGQPSLDNWVILCDEGYSVQDAPDGGGAWCLRMPMGNLQGCFPSRAEQVIPDVRHGDVIQIIAWVKQDQLKDSPTSIYLKVYHANGAATALSVDTSTSTEWTQLTVTDTLQLAEGDSVAIVLDPGVTSGPQILNSDSYFDLVEEKKIGEIVSLDNNAPELPSEGFQLLQNYPNPFNPYTIISWQLAVASDVELNIYNVLGKRITTFNGKNLHPGMYTYRFDGTGLASGVYCYRLTAGDASEARKMLLLR